MIPHLVGLGETRQIIYIWNSHRLTQNDGQKRNFMKIVKKNHSFSNFHVNNYHINFQSPHKWVFPH